MFRQVDFVHFTDFVDFDFRQTLSRLCLNYSTVSHPNISAVRGRSCCNRSVDIVQWLCRLPSNWSSVRHTAVTASFIVIKRRGRSRSACRIWFSGLAREALQSPSCHARVAGRRQSPSSNRRRGLSHLSRLGLGGHSLFTIVSRRKCADNELLIHVLHTVDDTQQDYRRSS